MSSELQLSWKQKEPKNKIFLLPLQPVVGNLQKNLTKFDTTHVYISKNEALKEQNCWAKKAKNQKQNQVITTALYGKEWNGKVGFVGRGSYELWTAHILFLRCVINVAIADFFER